MTNEEFVKQIQLGINSADNLELLYVQNKGMINKIVKRFEYVFRVNNSKTSVPIIEYQELMNEAYFGLVEAAQRYEDTAGVLFITYASFWIRQAITRYIENIGRTVRIPSGLFNKINNYKKFVAAYEGQFGRKPTDREICYHLGISKIILHEIRSALTRYDNIHSLDDVIPGGDDLLLEDTIPDQSVDIENDVINSLIDKSLRNELWQLVKDNVTPEENTIITARYRKSMTLKLAGESLGKSIERARQLEVSALRKLRRSRITRLLEEKYEINYARCYYGGLSSFRYTGTSIVEDIAIRNLETKGFAMKVNETE